MKKVGLIAIVTLAVSPLTIHAQDMEKGFFIGEDAGAVFQQRGTLSQAGKPDESVTFFPGARGDVDLGYNFCQSFAAEFEGGFMWDSIDKTGGTAISPGVNDNIYSIPLLGNLIFRMPTHCGLVPYFGIGGGGNVSILEQTSGGQREHDSDIEPAVQGEVGLNYRFSPNASLGVGYKFLGTLNEHYFLNQNGFDVHGTFHDVYIHGVFLNFTMNF